MKNCFAYNDGKCVALKEKNCKGCGFYQTRKEVEKGREKTIQRIKSLDKKTRDHILETYYGGRGDL